MKKLTSLFLIVCMLLTVGVTLISCKHECSFSEEWSKDENAHWHACQDEKCLEVSDKADHTWNEGEITTTATQEADGVKTYTCTVCGQTKEEAVAFTGMTEAEWNAALDASVFENFTYTETAMTATSGVEFTAITTQKYAENAVYMSVEMAGQKEEVSYTSQDEIVALREGMIDSIYSILHFADYEYDAETKTYQMTGEVTLEGVGDLDTASLKFEDGKLVELTYSCKVSESGVELTVNSTALFTDYGTTVVE